jgi:hypothetical protein
MTKLKTLIQMILKVNNCHECPFVVNNNTCNLQFLSKEKLITKNCDETVHKHCPIKNSPITIQVNK